MPLGNTLRTVLVTAGAALVGVLLLALVAAHLQLADARVEAAGLKTQIAQGETRVATARLEGEQKLRALEREKAEEAERIANAAEESIAALRAAAVRADRVAGGLRDEIARLNARPAPEDPRAAAFAHEAAVARELLGACAAEHRGLAEEADGLRIQVTGLIDYAIKVAGGGQ